MLRHDFPPLLSVGQSSAPAPLELQLVSKRRLANRRHAPSVLRGRESICSTTESIFSDPSRRSHTASTIGISTPAVCAASRSTGAVNAPSATVLRSAISTAALRSEEHTSELQSLMRISYAVFGLKKKTKT